MTLLVAELGHNSNGDMRLMKDMIHSVKECGADIAKFQLFDTDKIAPTTHRWYYDLKRGELSKEQWLEVVRECESVGIEFMASVFDMERLQWTEEVGMRRYKIASRIKDVELIKAICDTGKPVIASLGKFNGIVYRGITHPIDFLYCIAKYPAPIEEMQIEKVDFGIYAGLSDHSVGIESALLAMKRGARILEKHFTFDKSMDGCDHAGSMIPEELKQLAKAAKVTA